MSSFITDIFEHYRIRAEKEKIRREKLGNFGRLKEDLPNYIKFSIVAILAVIWTIVLPITGICALISG
jgi:hypothetical protein